MSTTYTPPRQRERVLAIEPVSTPDDVAGLHDSLADAIEYRLGADAGVPLEAVVEATKAAGKALHLVLPGGSDAALIEAVGAVAAALGADRLWVSTADVAEFRLLREKVEHFGLQIPVGIRINAGRMYGFREVRKEKPDFIVCAAVLAMLRGLDVGAWLKIPVVVEAGARTDMARKFFGDNRVWAVTTSATIPDPRPRARVTFARAAVFIGAGSFPVLAAMLVTKVLTGGCI